MYGCKWAVIIWLTHETYSLTLWSIILWAAVYRRRGVRSRRKAHEKWCVV